MKKAARVKVRRSWKINPVTKVKASKKVYSRIKEKKLVSEIWVEVQ